jgi:hypothetical protein
MTKILPSPICPVLAAVVMASMVLSTGPRRQRLDLDLGQETHGVFGAAIDFRVSLLASITFDFRHRETVNANGGQGVPDFFEFEWLDDRHNNFHGSYPRLGPVQTRPGVLD